jgi:hypothetical protein
MRELIQRFKEKTRKRKRKDQKEKRPKGKRILWTCCGLAMDFQWTCLLLWILENKEQDKWIKDF